MYDPEQRRKAIEAFKNARMLSKPFRKRSKQSGRSKGTAPLSKQKVSASYAKREEEELRLLQLQITRLHHQVAESISVNGHNDNQELEDLEATLSRLRFEESQLSRAIQSFEIVDKQSISAVEVSIGSKVTLCLQYKNDRMGTFEDFIVGETLSVNSPIGAAVLGKKPGDHFKVTLPDGEFVSVTIAVL